MKIVLELNFCLLTFIIGLHRRRASFDGTVDETGGEVEFEDNLEGTCPDCGDCRPNCSQCKKEECSKRRLGEELFPFTPDKEEYIPTTNDLTQSELIQEAKVYATKLGLNEEDADKVLLEIFNHPGQKSSSNKKKKNVDDFLEAKKYAAKLGLNNESANEVISKLFDSLLDIDSPVNSKLENKIKEDLSDPQKAEFIEKLINKNVEQNGDKYSRILALQLIGGAMDKQTGQLDGKFVL